MYGMLSRMLARESQSKRMRIDGCRRRRQIFKTPRVRVLGEERALD